MKNKHKSLQSLLFIATLFVSCFYLSKSVLDISNNNQVDEYNDKNIKKTSDLLSYNKTTFNELGTPTIADARSYYEDGTIYYTTTSSTVGYNLSNPDVLVDFNLTVNQPFVWPSWFSFNLRASNFGRTHGADVQNLGYVVMFYPSGVLSLAKDRTPVFETTYPLFNIRQKYHIQIGAVNEGDGLLVLISIDDNIVLSYFDEKDPIKDGNWFTLCGDSANGAVVNLTLESTWDVPVPKYETYTYSTLGLYAIRAGATLPSVDKYNNIEIFNGGQTVGFGRQLQNFSLSANYYITEMSTLSNLFINIRCSNFSRYNGIQDCYSFRFREDGTIFLYKIRNYQMIQIGLSSYYLSPNTNYYIEYGSVDYSDDRTLIFLNINNTSVFEIFDSDEPFQRPGIISINPEGTYNVKIGSVINSLVPLQSSTVEENDKYIIKTFLSIPFSSYDYRYEDFDDRVLKSILLDGVSVKDINNNYYSLSNDEVVRPVELYSFANQIILEINKDIYDFGNNSHNTNKPQELTLLRTKTSTGFITPNDTTLKNNYFYDIFD